MSPASRGRTVVWTIGHSTRSLGEFLELLASAGIRTVADVRRYPVSRRSPHFGGDLLKDSLPAHGLEYRHLPGLGGYRDDYRAYTASAEFMAALEDLLRLASDSPTAAMCAEADYRQCHRQILADVLVAQGVAVNHLVAPGIVDPHPVRRERPLEAFQ